jgi:hypothetical protein
MKDITAIMFMVGVLLCALSLTVHFLSLTVHFLSFILEFITKRKDFKWVYFIYNVSWWVGFPLFILSFIMINFVFR